MMTKDFFNNIEVESKEGSGILIAKTKIWVPEINIAKTNGIAIPYQEKCGAGLLIADSASIIENKELYCGGVGNERSIISGYSH